MEDKFKPVVECVERLLTDKMCDCDDFKIIETKCASAVSDPRIENTELLLTL